MAVDVAHARAAPSTLGRTARHRRDPAGRAGDRRQLRLSAGHRQGRIRPQSQSARRGRRRRPGCSSSSTRPGSRTMKQGGPALRLRQYADAISRTPSGRYVVTDPALRSEIMQLRKDPDRQRGDGAARSRSAMPVQLAERLGRDADRGRALHRAFPRARAAPPRLIKLAGSDPTANAAAIFPGRGARQPLDLLRQAGQCAQHRRGLRRARSPLSGGARHVADVRASPQPRAAAAPAGAVRLATAQRAGAAGDPATRRCRDARGRAAAERPAFASDTARRHQRRCGGVAADAPGARRAGRSDRCSTPTSRRGAVAPVVRELWGDRAGAATRRSRRAVAGDPRQSGRLDARPVPGRAADAARAVRRQGVTLGALTIRQSFQRFMVNALLSLAR